MMNRIVMIALAFVLVTSGSAAVPLTTQVRDTAMPSVLVEAGFLSHPVEGKKIFTTEYRKQMARAIVEGIQDYKSTVER